MSTSNHQKTVSAKRIHELDILRGVGAFGVVLYHYLSKYDRIYGFATSTPPTFDIGKYAINIFFLLSGFAIMLTLSKSSIKSSHFAIARISRLFPAYWAAIVSTFLVVNFFTLPGREVTVTNALINFTMLQDFFRVPSVDGAYWTLRVELSFYAIMFAIYSANLFKYIDRICVSWVLLAIIYTSLEAPPHFFKIISFLLITKYCYLMVAGISFYKIHINTNTNTNTVALILSITYSFLYTPPLEVTITATVYILLLLISLNKISCKNHKLFIFFGSISYSWYLTHQNIGFIIIRELDSLNFTPYTCVLSAMFISIFIATIITYCIEKPFQKIIRGHFSSSRIQVS